MANLLRAHPSIALGRERYNSLFKRDGRISPALFEKDRFCKILREGDSHHKHLDDYYQKLEARFEQCVLFGDKIPSLYRNYADLDRSFPNHKIIFLVRNIFDVAYSFEGRRKHSLKNPDASWPVTKGYKHAVSDWNLSLASTLAIKEHPHLMIVEYERLYHDDALCDALFDFLELDCVDVVRDNWRQATLKRVELEAKRCNGLNLFQKHYITKYASFSDYQALTAGEAKRER